MYLYLAHKQIAGAAPAEMKNWKVLALMPSTRGRAAKNHLKIELPEIDFHVAVIEHDKVDEKLVAVPDNLKTAISNNTQELSAVAVHEFTATALLGAAFELLLNELPAEYYSSLPSSMQAQLKAVQTEIVKNMEFVRDIPHGNYVKPIAATIKSNKKLLNSVLSATVSGEGWSCLDINGPRPGVKSETAAVEPVEETPADKTVVETNYGFNKIAAESGSETTGDEAIVNGVFVPKPDDTYIINEQVAHLFKILQISRRNCPQNVRLIGPHGCGKTELAIQFAGRLGLPLLIMDCANLREARDWFGYKTAREGTVYWHESQFVRAVEAGNHVILLDELNRANPHLLNTLMPLLDARRFTYLEEKGDKIVVGPGTVFFASMNEGAGYTGTSALDRAIRDRFPRIIEMTYLGEDDEINLLVRRVGVDEEVATRLVQMANKIRQDATGLAATLTESLSTRQLIAAAHDFAIGGVDTLTFTISNHFSPDGDDDSERVRVQNIIQGKFGDLMAAKAASAAKKGA